MARTLLSFIKTFLCPELSSWLHQMPAEHHLSFWHRDILWSSGFAFPGQMGRILYTSGHRCASFKTLGEDWGVGAWIFFSPWKRWHLGFYTDSLRWSTPAWYLEFAEKIRATLKSAGCHRDRWVSMWPQCHVFYASSVSVESLSLCQSYPHGCLSPDLKRLREAPWSSQAHSPRL